MRNAGMGWLVEQGLLEGDAVIITEPFGPDGVGIGHKGAIWGEITIFGKQAHGSAPQLGVNAVERWRATSRRSTAQLRPLLETRVTDYGVTPDNQRSTLSFDTIRGGHADQHRPRPLHRHLQPPADPGRGPRRGAARAARAARSYRPALRLPRAYSTQPTLVSEDEPVVQAAPGGHARSA